MVFLLIFLYRFIVSIPQISKLSLGIETINLYKKINKKTILDQLNLSIPKGSIHGLIGSNGAGKTTTLKILMGLVKPTSGIVRIDGNNIEYTSYKYKGKIGYLPEGPNFYQNLSIRELLEFSTALYNIDLEESNKRIDHFLNLFQIKAIERELISNLSRGELQRVAICSTMIKKPMILLLDEPFYTLDPKSQKIFEKLIIEEKKKNSCILLATHLLEYADKICDSITLISKGKSIFSGNLENLTQTYSYSSLSELYFHFEENGAYK
jgi:ABC-2 type transport system ATP-binding protein